jgi:hypothetical protein
MPLDSASSSRPRILLVPEEGLYLAFRLPRILRRAGYEVNLLCRAGHPLASSRYIDQVHLVNSDAQLRQHTITELTAPSHPWAQVIITDETLLRQVVHETPAEKLLHWQPALDRPTTRDFVLSKRGLPNARQTWGLPIPECRVVETAADLVACGNNWGWPVAAKTFSGGAGSGMHRLDNGRAAQTLPASLFPLLAQRYIHGRRGLIDMVCAQGRPLAWLCSWSTQRNHGVYGPSTAREFRAMPELQPLVETVAGHSGWEGFCGFDWIREDATGDIHLIEFHPRAPSGFRFGQSAGVDFALAVQAWLQNRTASFSPLTQSPDTRIKAFYFTTDLLRCLRQRDWRGLGNWLPRPGHRFDIYWDDPTLFLAWAKARWQARSRQGR